MVGALNEEAEARCAGARQFRRRAIIGATRWLFRTLHARRRSPCRRYGALLAPYDAMILPTTPAAAPTIEEVGASEAEYVRWNLRMLRNTGLINMLDGCAASIPMHLAGEPPVVPRLVVERHPRRRVVAVVVGRPPAVLVLEEARPLL